MTPNLDMEMNEIKIIDFINNNCPIDRTLMWKNHPRPMKKIASVSPSQEIGTDNLIYLKRHIFHNLWITSLFISKKVSDCKNFFSSYFS